MTRMDGGTPQSDCVEVMQRLRCRKGGITLKKQNIIKTILRVVFSLIFLGLAIWFILPMRVAIFDIGNMLGLFLSICGFAISAFWDKFKLICKKIGRKKLGKGILVTVFALTAVGISYVAVISGFMIAAAVDTPTDDSTVIVLGCKVNGTSPSLMLSKRLEAAYDYLDEHKNAVCIVSGGQGSNEGISEAQCMYNYLIERGISPDRVIREDKSTTTSENLEFSKKIIEQNGYSKDIAIVTDGFHEFRAAMLARKVGLNPTGAVSADTPLYLLATYHFRETIAIANEAIFGK